MQDCSCGDYQSPISRLRHLTVLDAKQNGGSFFQAVVAQLVQSLTRGVVPVPRATADGRARLVPVSLRTADVPPTQRRRRDPFNTYLPAVREVEEKQLLLHT